MPNKENQYSCHQTNERYPTQHEYTSINIQEEEEHIVTCFIHAR